MEWYEGLRWLVGIGIFLIPLAMLVLVGTYIILMPCGFLAGLILKRAERKEEVQGRDPTIRHAH